MILVPDWFVTSRVIKELFTALYADENVFYFNGDSDNDVLFLNEMGILNIVLKNTNLDNNFDEDDPDILLLLPVFWVGILNLKNSTHLQKDKSKINPNSVLS